MEPTKFVAPQTKTICDPTIDNLSIPNRTENICPSLMLKAKDLAKGILNTNDIVIVPASKGVAFGNVMYVGCPKNFDIGSEHLYNSSLETLRYCYNKIIETAYCHGCTKLVIPAIGTAGRTAFDLNQAAEVAVIEAFDYLNMLASQKHKPMQIYLVTYFDKKSDREDNANFKAINDAMQKFSKNPSHHMDAKRNLQHIKGEIQNIGEVINDNNATIVVPMELNFEYQSIVAKAVDNAVNAASKAEIAANLKNIPGSIALTADEENALHLAIRGSHDRTENWVFESLISAFKHISEGTNDSFKRCYSAGMGFGIPKNEITAIEYLVLCCDSRSQENQTIEPVIKRYVNSEFPLQKIGPDIYYYQQPGGVYQEIKVANQPYKMTNKQISEHLISIMEKASNITKLGTK